VHLFKSYTSGTYKPAFLSLFLNAPNVLTGDGKIDGPHGIVFFHEYIHFLQDLFTNFGLRNIIHLIQEYSVVNNEILNSPEPTFTIPYHTANEQVLLNEKMGQLLLGSDGIGYEEEDFEVVSMEQQPNLLDPALPFMFISVKILYRSTLETDEFYLGALHFLENMAHLLEKSFSYEDNAPPFPYKVIEKLVKRYFPLGDRSAENLIRVMEDALLVYNPAEYLFHLVEGFTLHNIPFNQATITAFKEKYKLTIGTVQYAADKLYYENAALTRKGFRILFHHEMLDAVERWAEHVMSNVIKIKRHGFSFTQLLTKGDDQQSVLNRVNYLTRKLGSPLIMDQNNTLFYSPPKPEFTRSMVYLLGLEAIISILRGELPCSVLPVCQHFPDGSDITNAHCRNAPWNRADQLPRCIVGELWVMWGFVRKQPVMQTE
jgi:hypothetical protein